MDAIVQNEISFLDLLVAIETSDKRLSLLVAVCDRDSLRASITERYEHELAAENISAYRVTIDHQDPSLYAAINKLIDTEPYLQSVNPAVITVEGIVSLSDFAPEGERSPLDTFLGYLQWTREGMRKFPFPIVIWVSERIHNEISRKAQDFYSWRQGVFFFEAEQESFIPIDYPPMDLTTDDDSDSSLDLPIDELLIYIAQREAEGKEDASLATFYTLLAKAYTKDRQIDLAIATWQKAIPLQQNLNLSPDLADSLNELGILYCKQEKYNQAEPLFKQALAMSQELLGDNHPVFAGFLNNLAVMYHNQRRYEEAEPLFNQALAIRQKLLGDHHSDVAFSLNRLAELYRRQKKYKEAESLFKQAMVMRQKLLGDRHLDVAANLDDLANLYLAQGRNEESESFLKQALAMRQKLLGDHHPDVANNLFYLAKLYNTMERNSESLNLMHRAISIYKQTLGSNHPTTKAVQSWLSTISDASEKGKERKKKEKREKGGFGLRNR